jgi:SAM-dependent methyltransferase
MQGDEVEIQRLYYQMTAHSYDAAHLGREEEHEVALAFLAASLELLGVASVLDVGAGTGRTLCYLKRRCPGLTLVGVEPVEGLRQVGYAKGLSEGELREGSGEDLGFRDGAFDLVCAFGVLHHVRHPNVVVSEMLRVGRKAIFISDANNFGQGSLLARCAKQALHALGLWGLANFLKTGGKGYMISEEDGLSYSYSVFDSYRLIAKNCKQVRILNTKGSGINPYRTASHVGLLGVR